MHIITGINKSTSSDTNRIIIIMRLVSPQLIA